MKNISLLLAFIVFLIPCGAVAMTGDIQISCEPKVKIYIDDEFKGVTNSFDNGLFVEGVSSGQHILKAVKSGYNPIVKKINIIVHQAVEIKINFKSRREEIIELRPEIEESVAKVGTLFLRSAPIGAKVYVDGQRKGKTDIIIKNLPIGKHSIIFSYKGKRLSDDYILEEDTTLKLKAHFKKGSIINITEIEKSNEITRKKEIEKGENKNDNLQAKRLYAYATQLLKKDFIEAEKNFGKIIDNYPNSIYADDALFSKIKIKLDLAKISEAEDLFLKLKNLYPDSNFINEYQLEYEKAVNPAPSLTGTWNGRRNGLPIIINLRQKGYKIYGLIDAFKGAGYSPEDYKEDIRYAHKFGIAGNFTNIKKGDKINLILHKKKNGNKFEGKYHVEERKETGFIWIERQ